MSKFFSGALVFAIAYILQFSFMPTGTIVNFVFAALIALSFIFSARNAALDGKQRGFWELFFFILAGVFLMNWQPAFSIALIVFAAIPIFTYFFHVMFPLEAWIGVIISLFAGFIILYLITAPRFIVAATPSFLIDLFVGSAFGFMVFLCMDRAFGEE